MKTEKNILAYLDGNMSPAELKKFREEMKKNPELEPQIALIREINEAIEEDDVSLFREQLTSILKKSKANRKSGKKRWPGYLKYAAAAIIFISVGIIVLFSNREERPDTVYDDYYSTYSSSFITRSSDDQSEESNRIEALYHQGFYEETFIIATEHLETHPEDVKARFYLGLSAMETGQFQNAIRAFSRVTSEGSTPYLVHSRWYLALSYLKTGDMKEARRLFKSLAKSENAYTTKAKDILKDIR